MPEKAILERAFKAARSRHPGTTAITGLTPQRPSRNALCRCAFGRRPASNSEIRSAFALVAMRNGDRPGVLVA